MAEGAGMEVPVEFRGRQHSFHSVASYHLKTATKRSAAVPLNFAQPQRPRFDDSTLSASAPIHYLPSPIVRATFADTMLDSDGSSSDIQMDGYTGAVSADMTDASSPAIETPPGSPEGEEDGEEPQRIVRPEDISLHNPDSGLGYRASRNDYHTDDSDDGHDEDEEDEESEKEDGEVSEPDDFPPSHPNSPVDELHMPSSPSPSRTAPRVTPLEVKKALEQKTLPYMTPLDLQLSFDPTVHMGLLMIDPSHQDRFNELYPPESSSSGSFTAYDALLAQYDAANAAAAHPPPPAHALVLNTELDEVDEIVEVIEEEDLPPPPANPPSSPAFLPCE